MTKKIQIRNNKIKPPKKKYEKTKINTENNDNFPFLSFRE